MAQRFVRPACVVLLLAAFGLDVATPQLLVVAILLNAPLALSSVALDRRFTEILVVAALVADAIAGYTNGLSVGSHWDVIALGNRVIAGISFVLVGVLSIAAQNAARRAGELAARESRAAAERRVARAVEAVRASINPDVARSAVAQGAVEAFDAERAWFFAFTPSAAQTTTYLASRWTMGVATKQERLAAAVSSFVERMSRRRDAMVVTPVDAVGRLLLDTLAVEQLAACSLPDGEVVHGILVVGRAEPFAIGDAEMLGEYGRRSALALSTAALFVELADRNTDLARANAALQERNDVIRDIVYALSHDLRTPLAAASMTMRQATSGAFGALPEQYVAILRHTLASNEELQRLAETLLLVSRYESGEASTRREPVDLTALGAEVVRNLESLWRDKGLTVDVQPSAEHAVVSADDSEIRRAIINLVANAIRFTSRGGQVRVRTAALGTRAELVVEDTGFGVPENQRATLFARVHGGTPRPGAGSGLGLYIVRRIAEAHGGTITYAARAGGGSVFSLTLPHASSLRTT